jgi:adenosylcobinamide-GDP ribazoletransferase
MKHLISAFQFLTTLPFGRHRTFDAPKIMPYFPAVGLVMGLILMAGDCLFTKLWPMPVVALLDVLLLAVLSGGLHLDGLGDTADGFFSHRPREQMLAIMRDSRIGAMGLITILFVIFFKWVGLQHITENRALFLLIVPGYARGAMLFGIRFLKYGRPDGGMGTDFFSKGAGLSVFVGMALPLLLSFWLGWTWILFNLLFVLMTGLILFSYKRRLNCITGDMLGAMVEVEEAWLFLVGSIGVMI